ncbi:MAG: helix-turn-helix transcriptional regulator [Candidatus Methanomethylicaceae archaeon]
MPRTFILKSSEGRTAPDFSLRSLAGSKGRMDLVARCIVAAFMTALGLRRDVVLAIVLEGPPNPPITVTINGRGFDVRVISEVRAAEILYEVLSGKRVQGISVERKGFDRVVMENNRGNLFYLHEKGVELGSLEFGKDPVFILGDQKGIDEKGEKLLEDVGAKRVSLGPYSYLASHCIVIINNEIDQICNWGGSVALRRLKEKITKENLWIYILYLLKERPLYAYEVKEKIKERFGFEPATITAYVVLYRLEREGLVKANQERGESEKVGRKYYYPTEKGLQMLEAGKEVLKRTLRLLESTEGGPHVE